MTLMRSNSSGARDIAYHLHSQTDLREHERRGPFLASRGEGIHVYDEYGRVYIEAMAGLWCASLGFSEKRLAQAASAAMERLPYYHTFNHKTHDACIDLADKLVELRPTPELTKVYFCTSGSEANDSMVKFAWYYQNARGRPEKRKVISRLRGFHGSTVAGASLTGLPQMHADFNLPLPGFLHADCPDYYRGSRPGETSEAFVKRLASNLEELILREGPETIAAFIAEPVMAAGGVVVPPAGYFAAVQEILRRHEILFLVDEVVCGFGRTGNWFGSQTFGLTPDMMSVAKGLSSGYMPIAAVYVADHLYQAIADRSHANGVFGHGFTYSGHPVCAAVARAAIRIYEEDNVFANAQQSGERLLARLRAFESHPLVGNVRGIGLMAAVELVADKPGRTPFPRETRAGALLAECCEENGLIVRALGDTIAFCPPLIITLAQVDEIVERFSTALAKTTVILRELAP